MKSHTTVPSAITIQMRIRAAVACIASLRNEQSGTQLTQTWQDNSQIWNNNWRLARTLSFSRNL